MGNGGISANLTKTGPESRVARFETLDALQSQKNHTIPQDVADLIWSRRLLPVVARADDMPGPFGTMAPIKGAGDMTITYAACPPMTGPSLHAHHHTFETFTVLTGRFEFSFGDEGQDTLTLDKFDCISVLPGVYRAFRNISDEDGLLQVIITGGIHDQNDIIFPAHTARAIAAHGAQHLAYFKSTGLNFVE
ncbi:cupin domain-containing protein [Govanella unica]|uniref:Cupin domain-containing protein n=1 Tax=Govanella unica TaxID=2975056 RepID=A0A9X3TYQ6_9PROT|nr:cupin domain-containing protein [Govania unica]MDA5194405.1 cupin domain-containing protein [Govania unica]